MDVMTDAEVRQFTIKNSWSSGLSIDEVGEIYYKNPEANCVTLAYPDTALRVTYVARVVSMLGATDEADFNGALLWLRLWTIGSPQLEKSGWRMMERMRMGFGELRSLDIASGHWFRLDEVADLAAFIVPCFVYGWDAYVVPAAGDCFAFISHDQFWCVATRNPEAYARVGQHFSDLEPRADAMKRRFCRPEGD